MVDTRFIVSKNRFPVALDMRDGKRIHGHVFLHFAKDETGVPESPIDLMNSDNRFMVFDEDLNGICFISKDSVLRIFYTDNELFGLDRVENFSTSILVSMSDGQQFTGDVSALLPEEHPRLFDLLNQDERKFLSMAIADGQQMLLNMGYINSVMAQ